MQGRVKVVSHGLRDVDPRPTPPRGQAPDGARGQALRGGDGHLQEGIGDFDVALGTQA